MRVAVLRFPGSNCDFDTLHVLRNVAGIDAEFVWHKERSLRGYDAAIIPGGFSYGDYLRSGAIARFSPIMKGLIRFAQSGKPVLGICNGFQIITNLGILPGALTYNKKGLYLDRWVDLKVVGKSPWLKNIKTISLPIAHGEGKYVVGDNTKTEIAFKYVKGPICKFQNLGKNPNGSERDIAGVLAYNGRVLGLMPHPERAMFSHQSPLWQNNKKGPKEGASLQIFKNAINYFRK